MTPSDKLSIGIEAATEFMNDFHPNRKWWIVGGALRDAELGRPFKDIDIFINGIDSDALPDPDVDDGDRNAYLRRASVETIIYQGVEFELNLIHMRGDDWTLRRVTERCDFGICMIGYGPVSGVTYRSLRYSADIRWNTLTLYRETTTKRRDRMCAKFPNHTYRNPYGLKYDGASAWCYNKETGTLDATVHRIKPSFT